MFLFTQPYYLLENIPKYDFVTANVSHFECTQTFSAEIRVESLLEVPKCLNSSAEA